jgi:hypothetical protein
MTSAHDGGPRANPLEILGAWLRVWTPPRDVEIPPVPRRGLAAAIGVLLVLVAIAVLVVRPAIDSGKDADAERRAEAAAAAQAQREAIARRDQQPRAGGVPDLAPATSPDARAALVAAVERAITADANARQAAGHLESRTRSTQCDPIRNGEAGGRAAYECNALIREITGQGEPGRLTYPFRAVLDLQAATWTFCKINPIPSEMSLPDPKAIVPLPRACAIPSD